MWWKTKFEQFDKSRAVDLLDTITSKNLLSEAFSYTDVQALSEEQRLALLCYWSNCLDDLELVNMSLSDVQANCRWLTFSLNDPDSDKTWYDKYSQFVNNLLYDVEDVVDKSIDSTLLTGMIERDKYEQLTEQQQLIVMFWQLDNYLNCDFDDPDYYVYENNYYIMTETLNNGICKTE